MMRTLFSLFVVAAALDAATWQVGPQRRYKTPCAAITDTAHVHDGDGIEIDAVDGNGGQLRYELGTADQCYVDQKNLTLRGVPATAKAWLYIVGPAQNQMGVFTLGHAGCVGRVCDTGRNLTVENLRFERAGVLGVASEAAIRGMTNDLTVRNCEFLDGHMGILWTPWDGKDYNGNQVAPALTGGTVTIENSYFTRNGTGDGRGQEHNLYVNAAERLIFRFNKSTCSPGGHLLKSRAAENQVLYNLFEDGVFCAAPSSSTGPGTDTYSGALVDFPNGGRVYFIGNILAQGARSYNSNMLTFGAEILANYGAGGRSLPNPQVYTNLWPEQQIYIINNTFLARATNRYETVDGVSFLNFYCRGDDRNDWINGWQRIPLPAGQTWIAKPPVVLNNVFWAVPYGNPPTLYWGLPPHLNVGSDDVGYGATEGNYENGCAGQTIYGSGGQVLGPPVLGKNSATAGGSSNWFNWWWDNTATDDTHPWGQWRFRDPGFQVANLLTAQETDAADVRITAASPLLNAGINPGSDIEGTFGSLVPVFEYAEPAASRARAFDGALDIGATEYGSSASSVVRPTAVHPKPRAKVQ